MLIAGMDVSGINDNYQYLGIVIGIKDNLDSLYNKMGKPEYHMSSQSKKNKEKIRSHLKFDQINRIGYCINIERKAIIENVYSRRISKYKRMSKGKLFAMFEKTLFKYVRHEIENFTLKFGLSSTNIVVECDDDCVVFAKSWGVKRLPAKGIHFISDAIAWCNTKNLDLDGVVELDLTDKIQRDLIQKLQR